MWELFYMNDVSINKKKSKRIFYFDALRALAIISVIIFHVSYNCGLLSAAEYSLNSWIWISTDIGRTFFRCGVDIFLMLSGALSLGRDWEIKSFLKKRIPRITAPFLFWGFILSLLLVLLSIYVPSLVAPLHVNGIGSFLHYLYNSYIAVNYGFTPYWFFWMILGTYLIMPIFNKWLANSDLKEAEYFLVIWVITCIFEFTLNKSFPVALTYFTGPIGMVVLGYYLRHTKRKIFNNLYVSIFLVIFSACLLLFLSYLGSNADGYHIFHRYHILMVIEVIGIFTLFKNLSNVDLNVNFFTNPNGIFKKSIFSIAKYSYGIYLIHRVIINIIFDYVSANMFVPYTVLYFGLIIATIVLSCIVMAVLNRIPYINQIIGAK